MRPLAGIVRNRGHARIQSCVHDRAAWSVEERVDVLREQVARGQGRYYPVYHLLTLIERRVRRT